MKRNILLLNALEKYPYVSTLIWEWSLWSRFLGKILLVSGPTSSGKTTLVFKIAEKLTAFKTFNRKILHGKIDPEVNKVFFETLFEKITLITGKKVTNINQLYEINPEDVSILNRDQLKALKDQAITISEGPEFKDFVLKLIFYSYYDEIKKYIFSGENIIIDEVLVDSDRSYSLFVFCFNYYPHIRRVLLFDTVEGTLEKCNIRNIKALELLEQSQSIEDFKQKLKKLELESGSSEACYRFPKLVFESYKEYYAFTDNTSNDKIILGNTTYRKITSTIFEIAQEHLKLLKILGKRGYIIDMSKHLINVEEELEKLPKKEIIYITSKSHFQYLIKASSITELTLLDNPNFLKYLLRDILPWLDGNISTDSNNTNLTINEFDHAMNSSTLLGDCDS